MKFRCKWQGCEENVVGLRRVMYGVIDMEVLCERCGDIRVVTRKFYNVNEADFWDRHTEEFKKETGAQVGE